jgi:regulatory helix-turn-helix LysR family protein
MKAKVSCSGGSSDTVAWPDRDSGALGALSELAAGGVFVAPARFGQHENGVGELLDGHRAGEPAGFGARVDHLEFGDRGADFEAFVVDRQCDQSGFEAPGADRLHELNGVLADDAHRHLRLAAHEVFGEPGKQAVAGGAERPQRSGPSSGQGMTLQQLTHLLVAAEHGSFTAAADALHLARPNVSEQIAQRPCRPRAAAARSGLSRCEFGEAEPVSQDQQSARDGRARLPPRRGPRREVAGINGGGGRD